MKGHFQVEMRVPTIKNVQLISNPTYAKWNHTVICHLYSAWQKFESDDPKRWRESRVLQIPEYRWEYKLVPLLWKTIWPFRSKLMMCLIIWHSNSIQGIHPSTFVYVHQKSHKTMFKATFAFSVSKRDAVWQPATKGHNCDTVSHTMK